MLVHSLLYMLHSTRHQVTAVGFNHLITFTLLLLSGERSFACALNKPVEGSLPYELTGFSGSYADLLIIVFHQVITTGCPKLSTVYSCFTTIISNIAPYTKGLSFTSSAKLLNLIEIFGSPRFIVAAKANYVFLQHLLDAVSMMIQYEYATNAVLIRTCITRRSLFVNILSMEIPVSMVEESSDRWTPSNTWLTEIKASLPIERIILRLIDYLEPLLKKHVSLQKLAVDDDSVIQFLKLSSITGVLPPPSPIIIRAYNQNKYTDLWMKTFIWSTIFINVNANDQPLFDKSKLKLFQIGLE